MYCSKCGNQVSDGAKFCAKCGQPFQQGAKSTTSAKSHKKTDKVVWFAMGISIVLLISAIVFLLRDEGAVKTEDAVKVADETKDKDAVKDKDTVKDKDAAKAEEAGEVADVGEAYEDGALNFTAIVSQCAYCEAPLNTLVEFCDFITAYGYDEDKINACSEKKYNEMQHDCTAEVIQVENLPYIYRGYYGTYSGEWQGAGPTGTGSFIGQKRLNTDMIAYTGEWKYGLPEGEGELYIINSINYRGNDFKYVGQMSAGLRNGTGYMYEYACGGSGFYRVYAQSEYQNDILAVETDAVKYDLATGEIISYQRLIGVENSYYPGSTAEWGANELSPEMKKVRDIALIAALGYLTYKAVGYASDIAGSFDHEEFNQKLDQQSFEYLEQYRARQQADLLKEEERRAKEAEKTRKWNESKYYEALYNDPDEYDLQTKNYKYNAGLGY